MKKFISLKTVRYPKKVSVSKSGNHLLVKVTYNNGSAMIKRPKLR